MSFELRCGTRVDNNILVFGWEEDIKAAFINIETKSTTAVGIEGGIKSKG